ncbi:MAG: dihydrolipoyl dehydrogenase [Ruminococcaceae bacterium]|nr:dihydrolipoyl dehydrogenase [Oscillospiraceae bacterium]
MMAEFDLIVIGAGPGGYVCAIEAAHKGLKTAIVEKRDVGGTCLNRGCIPTKALLHSAELYEELKKCEKYGINVEGASFDFGKIHEYKAGVVTKLRTGVESLFTANGITLIRGAAVITGEGKVEVDGTEYTAENIVIATGSTPAKPPIKGLDLEGVITSDELLDGEVQFDTSLIIIGGGVIGMEFASVYAALGTDVTVIEAMDRVLPTLDREISQNLSMILKKRGVKINTGAKVTEIKKNDDGTMTCCYEAKGKVGEAVGQRVLVAIGRRPHTEGLFGEGVEVETERGRIVVDGNFATSMKGVYAIGDVSSRIQLAHLASVQGIYIADKLAGGECHIDLSLVPSCIYTSPEIAAIGITEDEAKAAGINYKAGKVLMHSNGKTIIADGERGFIKLVTDGDSGKVLGATLMCERATDMLSELSTAVANGLTVEEMLKVMRPHPTFNEAVTEAFESINGTSIHSAPPRRR